ncbi:MAG: hypothetical protein H0V01_14295 [Bacteroidetes bacterium]|nr:hypothetical protein [Bacteroidota bacterium]HET6244689.1 glycosyltransferase family 10 [Bacteroidia bacterium]
MISVRLAKNYAYPDILRQTPGNAGVWKDIEFTFEPLNECDYLIVFNLPLQDIVVKVKENGTWLFVQEPPYLRNNYLKNYFPLFDIVYSHFESKNNIKNTTTLPWHINKTFDELVALKKDDLVAKNNSVSWITSSSNVNPGHEPRLNFLKFLKEHENELDLTLLGRGFQEIEDKFDGIYPSKYSIAIENYTDYDYFTEKIADVFLSWSMPIYYGCKNIVKYFPPDSMILIDIRKPEEALTIIKKAIAQDKWKKNLNEIEKARNLILYEYQFFPFVYNKIKKDLLFNTKPKIKIKKVSKNPWKQFKILNFLKCFKS